MSQPTPLGWVFPAAQAAQTPASVAVVMPTLLRPQLAEALESIYAQEGVETIQVLLGVDRGVGPPQPVEAAIARRPPNVSVLLLAPPYSTSERRGGVHASFDGGALRSILSFMANSRHVAYLDDDNAWTPTHLAGLLAAVRDKAWSYAQRLLIDEEDDTELAVDRWHSVGVGQGRFAARGGMVDPNCLLVDKLAVGPALARWSEGPGWHADRTFFDAIKDLPHGRVEAATVRYRLKRSHVLRDLIREDGP